MIYALVSMYRVGLGLTSEHICRLRVGAGWNSSGLYSSACDMADGITESHVLGGQAQAGVCSSFLIHLTPKLGARSGVDGSRKRPDRGNVGRPP